MKWCGINFSIEVEPQQIVVIGSGGGGDGPREDGTYWLERRGDCGGDWVLVGVLCLWCYLEG